MYFIFDSVKGFFGELLFTRTLCDSICHSFRFGERTQAISYLGSCAAQICRYTKTKPCQGNKCSFLFIHIWQNMAKHVFNKFMVLSPESHFARRYSDVVYSEVTCHLTTKLFPAKHLWAGNITKSFLLVVCETRFIFVIFPRINGPYVFDRRLSHFFFFGYVKS